MTSRKLHTTPQQPTRRAAPALAKFSISPDLGDMARLSIKEITALAGLCEQSIRNKIKSGEFPPADYRSGPRCVRWSAGLVRQWLESTRTPAEQ